MSHPPDCTCATCDTIRQINAALSEEAKINAAWMICQERRKQKHEAVDRLNRTVHTEGDKYEELRSDAVGADSDYQEACLTLVELLIERMKT